MQLGEILASASVPVVGRSVRFHVLKRNPDGTQSQALADATLLFVDESARHEADRFAEQFLRDSPLYKSGFPPADKRRDEEIYSFLMRSLRDSCDKARPFCMPSDYETFRRALVAPVVQYLMNEYNQYLREEYPEILTPEQGEQLIGEALGK